MQYPSLFDQIVDRENLLNAFYKTQKGDSKYRVQSIGFSFDLHTEIDLLREELIEGTYETSGYNKFHVYEPKQRLIFSPKFRDKVVHHAINNVLRDFFEPKFIHDSYSCIRNKGNKKAVTRLLKFTRQASKLYDNPYFCKIDIKKFFYTIDRQVVISIIQKRIPCQRTVDLLITIMDGCPEPLGLPLGNLSSQLLSNIMMNELDQFAKRVVGCVRYIRYSDDIIAVCPSKEQATSTKNILSNFILEILNIKPHPNKTFVSPVSTGIKALGFYVNIRGIFMTGEFKRKLVKKLREEIRPETISSMLEFVQVTNNKKQIHRIVMESGRWVMVYVGTKFKKVELINNPTHDMMTT